MGMEHMKPERPHARDFSFEVLPDREHGHVRIKYGNLMYKWFLHEDGKTVTLLNGDERAIEKEPRDAMKEQVRAILGPALKKLRSRSAL